MIIKIVNILILALVLVGCLKSKREQPKISNLEFIDTILVSGRKTIGMTKDSRKEGLWLTLFADGKIAFIEFFESNMMNGPFIMYYENGSIRKYMEMKNDINHGKYINYYDNGQIQSEMTFVNDTIDGIYRAYTYDGELEKAYEYNMGNLERIVYGPPPPIIED